MMAGITISRGESEARPDFERHPVSAERFRASGGGHALVLFLSFGVIAGLASGCGERSRSDQQISEDGGSDVSSAGEKWAKKLARPGIPNFHRVSNDLYRGAQPTARGMKELEKMGVKTVVNLRSFHSDRDEIGDAKLDYEHIYMKAWHPEDKEVVRFLRIVADKSRVPVFVHCMHGADRTGIMCAIYRVAIQGWSKEDALREMTEGDFGYHKIWVNLPRYFEDLDIDEMKRRAGLATPAGGETTGAEGAGAQKAGEGSREPGPDLTGKETPRAP